MAAIDVKFLLNEVGEMLVKALADKWILQGHNLSGRLIRSIRSKSEIKAREIILELSGESYGNIVNRGVKPENVPYSRGSGRRSSKFIEALMRYVKRRGITRNRKKQKQIAFAMANVMKKEGIPTKNSRRFSEDGTRTGAFESVIMENEEQIIRLFERRFGEGIEEIVFDLEREGEFV